MPIPHYMAMTAEEMAVTTLPQHTAWMACHFSPYSTGLCNLPQQLPPESLLILNDRTPIHRHDPIRIAEELENTLNRFSCCGLLLDFQNQHCKENAVLAAYLTEHLDFPIGISREYSVDNAAVFLPDLPVDVPLKEYLQPWAGRKIWLETALEGQTIRVTKAGTEYTVNREPGFQPIHEDKILHCRYNIQTDSSGIRFHLWRTRDDLSDLLEEAANYGVELGVGLFQEMQCQPH